MAPAAFDFRVAGARPALQHPLIVPLQIEDTRVGRRLATTCVVGRLAAGRRLLLQKREVGQRREGAVPVVSQCLLERQLSEFAEVGAGLCDKRRSLRAGATSRIATVSPLTVGTFRPDPCLDLSDYRREPRRQGAIRRLGWSRSPAPEER